MRSVLLAVLAWLGLASAAMAAPAVTEGDYTVANFEFNSGQTLPQLKLHYRTLGAPKRDAKGRVTNAVMILHGTGGSGAQFLRPQFADVLFKPGGLLDPAKYYVILPDGIGHGGSSKPSDGLHARFPMYGYQDMVEAQRLLLVDGLKVDHLRLILGTSMGCMHAFVWGEEHPAFADALMPLACLPTQIAGRNRLWRTMLMDAIRRDPAWMGGDYKTQPMEGLRTAEDLLMLAGAAPLPMQNQLPTLMQVDSWYQENFPRAVAGLDANDLLYQVNASRDYDPSADLEKITAPVMWVNSADDFINPPELGLAEGFAKRLKRGTFVLIPAGPDTHGHGTHTWAAIWQDRLAELLDRSGGR
ncbi:homoserine O-acetyltransferase [Caulobacter ginsengisoli]|uniref:Homoserine O-acetyltransferase n=1 Tax=Caulobacter ginsengisoli TaxID=400775 RepID=A0ABU0IMJ9_9CAUL|nr:alpha/beta fold hydrolase [Caulobacter ginsengisoli]MDQ0463238.1 homoserine O-acetyltransferase [Caulobacter ginsengisoli]